MEVKFKNRLKELRAAKGISQYVLADALGFKQPTIAKWEKGIIEVNFETLIKLAKYFETTTDYLLGLTNF